MASGLHFPNSHLEGWFTKTIPLIALLITTTVSTALLYLNLTRWNFQHVAWTSVPSFMAGIIQVVVEILAAVQIFALLTLVNFATRIALCRSNSTLDVLKYRAAICLGRIDLSLPWLSMTLVILVYGLMKVPAFLWANSLALSPSVRTGSNNLYVPILGADNFIHNFNGDELKHCWRSPASFPNQGLFLMAGPYSSCPGRDFVDGLLEAASTVSLANADYLPRIDVDGAFYSGRSYGVGAAVGHSDTQQSQNWGDSVLASYTYQDLGFNTEVLCNYNSSLTSADWSLWQLQAENKNEGIPAIFEAKGQLPDGSNINSTSFYTTWGWSVDETVAWQTTNSTYNPNYISTAAGFNYKFMNATQCTINFIPTMFDIMVTYPSQSSPNMVITVTPNSDEPLENAVDPTWHLQTLVLEQITALSMVSTTLYGSVLGEAFLANAQACSSNATNTAQFTDNSLLPCMQQSWESIIDNLLLLLTAAQIVEYRENNANGPWDPAQFREVFDRENGIASQIGTRMYILLTCALNAICLIIWIIEAFRWSFWKDLPKFNILDLKSAVLGGAMGGGSIVATIREVESPKAPWTGASDDEKVGEIQVQVAVIDADENLKRVSLKASLGTGKVGTIGRRPWAPFSYDKVSGEESVQSF
ncbi:uncharacterized protein LY89DRAFT_779606 [Mollisia scopiformis]|uniref:Uncharacterized protein n=1 Tax=Mollisia scopiformis TaxID=149040 RepID=A0A194XHS5_MOLSC|nr:uncharacterized protein LY89DRAFT_779606 [Mollisia scopiformis]KUJ19686.1 hypothetical protein LY89DRAFT_779606 [Mollisia scopiformis]